MLPPKTLPPNYPNIHPLCMDCHTMFLGHLRCRHCGRCFQMVERGEGALADLTPPVICEWPGGTVVPDPSGTGYHLFAAVMAGNLSLQAGWENSSTVEHLFSSGSPAGPFAPHGTASRRRDGQSADTPYPSILERFEGAY